jgi:hypothetical protein
MTTSPVMIPWTAPMQDGFPKKAVSRTIQVSMLVAVAMLVCTRTARQSAIGKNHKREKNKVTGSFVR